MSANNSKYVNNSEYFAKGTPLQAALRELHGLATNLNVWIGLFAVILILSIAGPFGTIDTLSTPERFFYWGFEAILTLTVGVFFAVLLERLLANTIKNELILRAIVGILIGFPVSLVVWSTNLIAFGEVFYGLQNYLKLLLNCIAISFAVSVIYFVIVGSRASQQAKAITKTNASPFINRLPVELGKNLLHLSSQDHYVEAVTDRGSHLVLMRFSDAVKELGPDMGFQIHRAYWVSHKGVARTSKENGRMILETTDGRKLPVSRTYIKQVRQTLGL